MYKAEKQKAGGDFGIDEKTTMVSCHQQGVILLQQEQVTQGSSGRRR